MANRLNMATIQAIEQLQALKWSQRKIARELGIDRGAVARHLRRLATDPKAAIPPAGSVSMAETNSAAQTPSNAASPEASVKVSPAGRRSQCETCREVIQAKLHGTTKRQVAKLFAEERPTLLPLRLERFASFHEAQRKVSRARVRFPGLHQHTSLCTL
jgi:DNA invertase Pin-like site-specific DNA recombinase